MGACAEQLLGAVSLRISFEQLTSRSIASPPASSPYAARAHQPVSQLHLSRAGTASRHRPPKPQPASPAVSQKVAICPSHHFRFCCAQAIAFAVFGSLSAYNRCCHNSSVFLLVAKHLCVCVCVCVCVCDLWFAIAGRPVNRSGSPKVGVRRRDIFRFFFWFVRTIIKWRAYTTVTTTLF